MLLEKKLNPEVWSKGGCHSRPCVHTRASRILSASKYQSEMKETLAKRWTDIRNRTLGGVVVNLEG
jgi:hypothetical protein